MKKSDLTKLPLFYDTYINLMEDIELLDALEIYGPSMFLDESSVLIETADKVYAPGKWSVKTIIQHVIDAERVFCYRALRFARNDKTELPGFDENNYSEVCNAGNRKIEDLLKEFQSVRESSILMFKSFDVEMLNRTGMSSGNEISVAALGFAIAGHSLHHFNVIMEKYVLLA